MKIELGINWVCYIQSPVGLLLTGSRYTMRVGEVYFIEICEKASVFLLFPRLNLYGPFFREKRFFLKLFWFHSKKIQSLRYLSGIKSVRKGGKNRESTILRAI